MDAEYKFQKKIDDYLESKGYSRRKLAFDLGIDETTVGRWINGERKFRRDSLEKTCKILQLTVSQTNELIELYDDFWQQVQTTKKKTTTVTPLLNVPLQKPPRVPYFTGRDVEIEQILEDLQPGRVVTLCGPGGIGKSSLTAEVIEYLTPGNEPPKRFPDGIIHYNFYRQGQADSALEHIAHSFSEDSRPTPKAAAQRILAGRQALLILDGAENADDLDKILEIRGQCGVLITTRHKQDVTGITHFVETLPLDESRRVLQDWSRGQVADQDSAEQICELVGFLPLALRLAGSYIFEHGLNAEEYLGILKKTPLKALTTQERQRESIPVLLEKSLAEVSETSRQVLAIVAFLIAPFDLEVITATLEFSMLETKLLLGELVKYSFAERLVGTDLYSVTHALIQTYARYELPIPSETLKRLATYYLKFAEEQRKLRADPTIRLFDAEKEISSIEKWYGELENRELAHELSYTNLVVMSIALLLEGGSPNGEWLMLNQLSKLYQKLGQTELANEYAQQAQAIWGLSSLDLADEFSKQENWEKANYYYQQALTFFREQGDRRNEGICLGHMALGCHLPEQSVEQIIDYLQQALAISREVGDRLNEGNWLGVLGSVYVALEQYQQALEYYQQAVAIAQEIGEHDTEAGRLGELGGVYHVLGYHEEAIEAYQKAADIYLSLERFEEAVDHYQRRIGLRDDDAFTAYVSIGFIAYRLGENAIARQYLETGLTKWEKAYEHRLYSLAGLLAYKAIALMVLKKPEQVLDTFLEFSNQYQPHEDLEFTFYDPLIVTPQPPFGLRTLLSLLRDMLEERPDSNLAKQLLTVINSLLG